MGWNRFIFTKSDGQQICRRCRKCLRGYGIVQRCSARRDTICKICPEGTFSKKRGHKCKPCRQCPSESEMLRPCSPFLNTKCKRRRCKKGSYMSQSKTCQPCTICPPGTFVDKKCTKRRDAVCLPCPQGTYSDEYNLFPFCKICKHCRRFEDITQICNAIQNNICGDCNLGENCSWTESIYIFNCYIHVCVCEQKIKIVIQQDILSEFDTLFWNQTELSKILRRGEGG